MGQAPQDRQIPADTAAHPATLGPGAQLLATGTDPVTGPSPELGEDYVDGGFPGRAPISCGGRAAPTMGPHIWLQPAEVVTPPPGAKPTCCAGVPDPGRLLMPTTLATEDENVPAASTTSIPRVDVTRQLSTRTLAWLADHPHARRLVRSVWDKLTELERAGHHPDTLAALRRVLTCHQPTSAGRCRTCRRRAWRRCPFPCIVWHQVRGELFGWLP